MSVCLRPPRWKRRPRPRGLAPPSVSAILGRPVDDENRAVRGVEGVLKWGALLSEAAAGVGVKVPRSRWPFAWTVSGCV